MTFGTIEAYEAFAEMVGAHNISPMQEVYIEILHCSLRDGNLYPMTAVRSMSEIQKPLYIAHLEMEGSNVLRQFLDNAGDSTLDGVFNSTSKITIQSYSHSPLDSTIFIR